MMFKAPMEKCNTCWMMAPAMTKPTPTLAETELPVAGLRAGHYLCFFGMHVLTPGGAIGFDGDVPRVHGRLTGSGGP